MKVFVLEGEHSSGTATYIHELFLQAPDKLVRRNVGKVLAACINSLF